MSHRANSDYPRSSLRSPPFLLPSLGTRPLSPARTSTADSARRPCPFPGLGSRRLADPPPRRPRPFLPRPPWASTRPRPLPRPPLRGCASAPSLGRPRDLKWRRRWRGVPAEGGQAGSRRSTATAAAAVATAEAPANARPRPRARPRAAAARPPARTSRLNPCPPPCRAPVRGEGRLTTLPKTWGGGRGFCTISDDCLLVQNNLTRRGRGSWTQPNGGREAWGLGYLYLCEGGEYGMGVEWAPEPSLMGRADSWLPREYRDKGYGRGTWDICKTSPE